MARANFKPIPIPEKVSVSVGEDVRVKGPLGELSVPTFDDFKLEVKDGQVLIDKNRENYDKAKLGLLKALIQNAIIGVTKGYEKVLYLWGVGYRVEQTKDGLRFFVGYSHPVDFKLPEGIKAEIDKPPRGVEKDFMAIIKIKGIDKQLVGEIAARIRRIKPPDPYKGKGLRYADEEIRLKPGKRSVA